MIPLLGVFEIADMIAVLATTVLGVGVETLGRISDVCSAGVLVLGTVLLPDTAYGNTNAILEVWTDV